MLWRSNRQKSDGIKLDHSHLSFRLAKALYSRLKSYYVTLRLWLICKLPRSGSANCRKWPRSDGVKVNKFKRRMFGSTHARDSTCQLIITDLKMKCGVCLLGAAQHHVARQYFLFSWEFNLSAHHIKNSLLWCLLLKHVLIFLYEHPRVESITIIIRFDLFVFEVYISKNSSR